jgi:hypothetical protein
LAFIQGSGNLQALCIVILPEMKETCRISPGPFLRRAIRGGEEMKSRIVSEVNRMFLLVLLLSIVTNIASAQGVWFPSLGQHEAMFEFVGQVKNFPPAGPGLAATSIQYGYLSHVQGLTDDQIYLSGGPQNETNALFTFYNDSVTEKVTNHGSLKIVIREGTTTIYYNPVGGGDLSTPNPSSFRQGTPVLTTKWRHQVILDGNPSPDPTAPARTNLFFVTWWHTITSSQIINLGGDHVLLGRVGGTFQQHLVGGVDFTGTVNGKFAGYAESLMPVVVF